MFNVYQYNSSVRMAERQHQQQERYARYILKHQDLKQKALQKQKEKVQSFIKQQSQTDSPFIFEDDHYKHWRPLKQFRDVEDSKKFLAYKTFRHKPHYDMDKFFNQRERIQIKELSERKQHLVRSKIIPDEQRARSLRCQGPLNPKIQFRERKKDHEYIQPRLRFSNITDRERMNQTAMSYDDKFHSLYKSFQMTKSKLGKASISPRREKSQSKLYEDIEDGPSQEMVISKPFHFERESLTDHSPLPGLDISSKMSQKTATGNSKTYFKLAKTFHLFESNPQQKEQLQSLMKRTQYERRKDLSNLRHNLHNQNHLKRPIL